MKNKKKTLIVTIVSIGCVAALSCGLGFGLSASSETVNNDQALPDTVLDIANGSNDTVGEVNSYDRYQQAYDEANQIYGTNYKVQFSSGGADHTHQYIIANVLRILSNDVGNSIYNDSTYSTLLLEGTDWPDKHDMGFIFNSHFYNPYTEKNFNGGATTAKSKAIDYYNKAVSSYKSGDVTSAMQYLGRGSHFVSDSCETHHANNRTAVDSNHSAYESYIDDNRTSYTLPGNSYDKSVYQEALRLSVGQIVRNNGYASYELISEATGSSSNPDYSDTARSTVLNAMMSNVQYFYKFGIEVGIYKK